VEQGTVKMEYCVSDLSNNCEQRVEAQVRACVGGSEQYYVYKLVRVATSCQWAYCARSTFNGPS